MKDINTPLITAYYDVINPLGYPVFVGEEPDNVQHASYIVISTITASEASNHSFVMANANIQVGIYTWQNQANTVYTINQVADDVLQALHNLPRNTLSADGMQIVTTTLTTDRTEPIGTLAGRKYINRILIFSHLINLN